MLNLIQVSFMLKQSENQLIPWSIDFKLHALEDRKYSWCFQFFDFIHLLFRFVPFNFLVLAYFSFFAFWCSDFGNKKTSETRMTHH